jgi:hypothetical protein
MRVRKRILHIKIEKASLKHAQHKSFVTYQLWNETDEFTKAVVGQNPIFNYIQKHELTEDAELKDYLTSAMLEFQLFDDNVPIMPVTAMQEDEDNMPSDFIGKAEISLQCLNNDKMIN